MIESILPKRKHLIFGLFVADGDADSIITPKNHVKLNTKVNHPRTRHRYRY